MENTEEIENISDLYHNEESLTKCDNRCGYKLNALADQEPTALESQCFEDRFYSFPEASAYIQDFLHEDNMSYSSTTDDLEVTSAVFQQFDTILRQQVHTEIEVFKNNINRILTDQQYQFKQAFGLPDPALNATEAVHVVPQSNYVEEGNSEECQIMPNKAHFDSEKNTIDRLCWYHLENYPPEKAFTSQDIKESAQSEEEKLTTDFLVRMLTADCAITAALRRKEYAS